MANIHSNQSVPKPVDAGALCLALQIWTRETEGGKSQSLHIWTRGREKVNEGGREMEGDHRRVVGGTVLVSGGAYHN